MKRILLISLIGVVIIGGASASALTEVDCVHCDATGTIQCDECRQQVICSACEPEMVFGGFVGKPDCPKCRGIGITFESTGFFFKDLEVECGCRGQNPECPFCRGRGSYASSTAGLCEACQGKGGSPCPGCAGSGKIKASERFLEILGLR